MTGAILTERIATDNDNRAKVEIITDTTLLIVNDGMADGLTVLDGIAVAIEQYGIGLMGYLLQTLQGITAQCQGCCLHVEKGIASIGFPSHAEHSTA